MSGELIPFPTTELNDLFSGSGLQPTLDSIAEKVRSYSLDASTQAGRDEIASIAYKVARSKTAIDNAGKELVSGIKAEAKKIDEERKRSRDFLDALKEEVRKPVTEFEEAEKKRVAELESRLAQIEESTLEIPAASSEISEILERIKAVDTDTFAEFSSRAKGLKDVAVSRLEESLRAALAAERERAELERLRKEKEEREQKEREERIAREAEERAKREAEEKAKREREEVERKHREEIERQKAEAERREREAEEKRQAEERARKAEADRKAAEERAAAEAEAKRQADKKHRAAIEAESREDLLRLDCVKGALTGAASQDLAGEIIAAIAAGEIRNLQITY